MSDIAHAVWHMTFVMAVKFALEMRYTHIYFSPGTTCRDIV
jgi:hypothetical protein